MYQTILRFNSKKLLHEINHPILASHGEKGTRFNVISSFETTHRPILDQIDLSSRNLSTFRVIKMRQSSFPVIFFHCNQCNLTARHRPRSTDKEVNISALGAC